MQSARACRNLRTSPGQIDLLRARAACERALAASPDDPRLQFETARRMRQTTRDQKLKLIALSGWGQEDDRRRTREAGFDLHITKPASMETLENLLRSMSAI